MRPETVLNLKPGDDPARIRDEWIKEYDLIAAEFYNDDLISKLKERVNRAFKIYTERKTPEHDPFPCHDVTYYEELDRVSEQEELTLDGDFPLGNEKDAEFANLEFSISELAEIQCGLHHLISAGNFTGHNYGVLVRRGFIAELFGDYPEAVRCYEGVSGSKNVQDREYECRGKMKAEGERLYSEAQEYMQSGRLSEVFAPLNRAADMKNTDAMVDLALARVYGHFGCATDLNEALELLRSAAAMGNARACFELCELYDSGIYEVDAIEAKECCEKAASLGYEKAKQRLSDGFDLRDIHEILKEQIDNGNIDAIWKMAQLCEREKDLDSAADWFDKAIEAGQVDALLKAAEVHLDKESGAYSEELADRYLRRAANQGSVLAIIALGDREVKDFEMPFWIAAMRQKSLEMPMKKPKRKIREQHKKQLAWYQFAAEAGDTDAMNALSIAYHMGYPIDRDDMQAFLWASRAADAGDPSAMYQAAYFYENGFGTDKDVDAALLLYIESAEMGVRSSMIRLYEIYTLGLEHIKPDGKMAAHYLWMSGEGRD